MIFIDFAVFISKKGLFENSNDYFMLTDIVDVCHSHETIWLLELLFFYISNKELFSYLNFPHYFKITIFNFVISTYADL